MKLQSHPYKMAIYYMASNQSPNDVFAIVFTFIKQPVPFKLVLYSSPRESMGGSKAEIF